MDKIILNLESKRILKCLKQKGSILVDNDENKQFVKKGTGGNSSANISWLEYEFKCLSELDKLSNNHQKIPKPIHQGTADDGTNQIITEQLTFDKRLVNFDIELARALANLHLSNHGQKQFGFYMDGCCGDFPQFNNCRQQIMTWQEFLKEQRLKPQLESIQNEYSDQEVYDLGLKLLKNIEYYFMIFLNDEIKPCLLHGDLHSGNVSMVDGQIVMFDPAGQYGHHEADLGMVKWMGNYSKDFIQEQWKQFEKKQGYEDRILIYQLYHEMNHYNIFGNGYRGGVVSLLTRLTN